MFAFTVVVFNGEQRAVNLSADGKWFQSISKNTSRCWDNYLNVLIFLGWTGDFILRSKAFAKFEIYVNYHHYVCLVLTFVDHS